MQEVKKPKKPLIYYYIIAMGIILLFNMFAMPWIMERQVKEVDYGTFLSMVDSGQVSKAEIQDQDNLIYFTCGEESTVYKTIMVNDPDLTQRLYEAGVLFYGQGWSRPRSWPICCPRSCLFCWSSPLASS